MPKVGYDHKGTLVIDFSGTEEENKAWERYMNESETYTCEKCGSRCLAHPTEKEYKEQTCSTCSRKPAEIRKEVEHQTAWLMNELENLKLHGLSPDE